MKRKRSKKEKAEKARSDFERTKRSEDLK